MQGAADAAGTQPLTAAAAYSTRSAGTSLCRHSALVPVNMGASKTSRQDLHHFQQLVAAAAAAMSPGHCMALDMQQKAATGAQQVSCVTLFASGSVAKPSSAWQRARLAL